MFLSEIYIERIILIQIFKNFPFNIRVCHLSGSNIFSHNLVTYNKSILANFKLLCRPFLSKHYSVKYLNISIKTTDFSTSFGFLCHLLSHNYEVIILLIYIYINIRRKQENLTYLQCRLSIIDSLE